MEKHCSLLHALRSMQSFPSSFKRLRYPFEVFGIPYQPCQKNKAKAAM